MRKTISLFLALVIMISISVPTFAAKSSEEYYTIQAEYSDNIGHKESLSVMIQNDNVFVDAKMLAERLGYTFGENDECAVIFNTDKSNDLPFGITQFKYNSTEVSHMLFNNMIDTYEAPFASIKNSEGSWIPFEYSLLLLNSGMMITDKAVLIDIPTKRIIDDFFDVAKKSSKYSFDWADDFGYTEADIRILGGSSHLINIFNGALGFDGASWASLFQQFAGSTASYDKKYGENLAVLLCTESDKELQASTEKVKLLSSLLNVDGDLGKLLSFTSDMSDFQVGSLYKQCETILDGIKMGNSSAVDYSRAYQALEKALDKQTWFSHTGGNILDIQKGVSSATGKVFSFLDVAVKVAEIVGYAQEFQNQDEFSLAAFTHYLESANNGLELPNAMKASMINYSDSLSASIDSYIGKRFLDNIDQWILDAAKEQVPLYKVLGTQAAAALIAWDIASNTIPFISNGLEGADNFELALYSMVFQSDTFINYLSKRDSIFVDTKNISPENMYELSQYCYIYLKSCYITREAALASLINKSDSTKEKIQPLIDYQNSINTEIAKILVELKGANKTNDGLVFGFLPSDNKDYLDKYDNSQLIQWVRTIESETLDDIYINFLETQGYQPFMSDWIYGQPNKYAILDINQDGIDELIITGGNELGFYNFAVFSYNKTSNDIYALSIPGNVTFGEDYTGNVSQYYDSLQYSPKYHALVFTELNNGPMFDSYGYYVIDDRKLVVDFSLWFEMDYETQQASYGISNSDSRETISQTDYNSYIDEIISLEWSDIPTLTSSEWKQAYIDYINEHRDQPMADDFLYKLVDINGDAIPELYVNYGTTAAGDAICTYAEGSVVEQSMWNYGFSYLEGQNRFRNAGGHMDVYYDKIYTIENGQFVLLCQGNYGASDNTHVSLDSNGLPIYTYRWNGTEVASEAEYTDLLHQAYDMQKAVTPFDGADFDSDAGRYVGNGLCNYEEILVAIRDN